MDSPRDKGPAEPAGPGRPPSPGGVWIYGPSIDLLAGCGAWSAPLLLLTAVAATSNVHAWTFTFYSLALLFNYPHFMATVYRAYHSHTEFTKYRIYTVHIALLLALTGLVAHLWFPLLPWIFTLYICWSPWHYTGQNFGLMMMFAGRSGLKPTEAERRALRLGFISSYLMLMLSFHTGPSNDPVILSLGLPATVTLPARIALMAFFLAACGWALASLKGRAGWRALAAPGTLALTQFFWFLAPALIEMFSGRQVPQTRYSSGILAVLHSVQYLWITSYYQEREARAAGNTGWRYSRYLVTLVAGGVVLFIPGPWMVSRLFHADFAASFLTFTALVNIHHFILDGAVWKLRDSKVASLLLEGGAKPAAGADRSDSLLVRAGRWASGSRAGARALRFGLLLVIFAWAAVDLVHFFWSSQPASVAALERAASLNPYDSAVLTKLARASMSSGKQEEALRALRRAAEVNPGNRNLGEAYARALIEAGRDRDAYEQYQKLLERAPRDANALVNFGLLAHRLGQDEVAVDSWQKAIAVDSGQAHAQLYVAQALEQRGEPQAAARHYRAYAQSVAAHPAEYPNERGSVLAALVRVADADAAANRTSPAVEGYTLARGFAAKAGDKTMESLALVRLADLQEKLHDDAGAATSYQHALALDAATGDPRSAATDWFNYGQFLSRRHQPETMVLACLLRAEELLGGAGGEELRAISEARQKSEARLGKEAPAVRRNVAKASAQAAALPPATVASGP